MRTQSEAFAKRFSADPDRGKRAAAEMDAAIEQLERACEPFLNPGGPHPSTPYQCRTHGPHMSVQCPLCQVLFTANALDNLAARAGTPTYSPLTLADVAEVLRGHAADLRKVAGRVAETPVVVP